MSEPLTDHLTCNVAGVVKQRTYITFNVETTELYEEGPVLSPDWETEGLLEWELESAKCIDHEVVIDV